MAENTTPDLPADWDDALRAILARPARRVLVLGPTDAGKSSFCRALIDAAGRAGRAAGLLDCDPGQKMAGPPAAVTYAGWPADSADAPGFDALGFDALGFVGATNPLAGMRRLLGAMARLLDEFSPALLVANTSGLLADGGRRLKAAKIGLIRPDLLVAIGQHPDLDTILAEHSGRPSLRLAPSPLAGRKPAGARRLARRQAFRRYFAGAVRVTFEIPGRAAPCAPFCERMLIGLGEPDGRDRALGIVESLDPVAGRIGIRTPLGAPHGCRPIPGLLRLDEDFRERPLPGVAAPGPGARP